MSTCDDLTAFSELRGNTLQVYLCMVRTGQPMGIRELQRKLDFSSPTLVVYHLDKLENLNLVEKTEKGYVLAKEVKIGALVQMVKFGGLLLPRHVFYVAIIATMFFLHLIAIWFYNSFVFDKTDISALLMGLTALLIMIYECVRIWKQKIV